MTTYTDAGVNVAEGDAFVEDIKALVHSTRAGKPWVNADGSIKWSQMGVPLSTLETRASTDGAGTKPDIALMMNDHLTIGQDNVAMSVNDLVRDGFVPYEFVDYYATSKLDRRVGYQILKGTAQACLEAGCALTGGETAEMPGTYQPGKYDICGTANGYRRYRLAPKQSIQVGHRILAAGSSGVHCNGYSLVRKIVADAKLDMLQPLVWNGHSSPKALGRHLLEPTRLYVNQTLAAMSTGHVLGCAHITGGGIEGKFGAILPDGLDAEIRLDTTGEVWRLFGFLQETGNVPWEGKGGMYRTFNLGYGMVYVVAPKHVQKVIDTTYIRTKEELLEVGCIVPGKGGPDRVTFQR